MVRSIDELNDIFEAIRQKVFLANRQDNLDELLKNWGIVEEETQIVSNDRYKTGKIVVVGNSEIKEEIMQSILKDLGIKKDRLETCLDYELAQKFNYRKMSYNPNYAAILFGPVPHSAVDKEDSGSIIAEIEKGKGYPPMRRIVASNGLKITKNSFKKAMYELLNENIIIKDN